MSNRYRQRIKSLRSLDINDGDEHQARDGSNLRTMAEAEQDERAEAAVVAQAARVAKRQQQVGVIPRFVGNLWYVGTMPLRVMQAVAQFPWRVSRRLKAF